MRAHLPYALAAAAALTACSGGHEPARADDRAPVAVTLHTAQVESLAQPFEVGGVVRSRVSATLVSRIVATVEQVLVTPGQRVRAGQPLVRLDGRDLQANRARAEAAQAAAEQGVQAARTGREAAEANLALATATHRRIAELRDRNSATPNELDQAVSALKAAQAQALGAQAGIQQAEAGAEAARQALVGATVAASYSTITAPFDGVVTEKLVDPGNMAAPGVPLIRVEDTRGFRLEVSIDEARVGEMDRSRPVDVLVDSPAGEGGASGVRLGGTIAEVARALDPGSHAFLVKIDLPDHPALRSGMFGRARFAGPVHRSLVVPEAALVRRGQLTSVFVAGGDNRARLRLVNVGDAHDGRVEVSAGLDAGESVILAPPPTLVDGAPIRAGGRTSASVSLPAAGEVRR